MISVFPSFVVSYVVGTRLNCFIEVLNYLRSLQYMFDGLENLHNRLFFHKRSIIVFLIKLAW